jgi:hypothetical protein
MRIPRMLSCGSTFNTLAVAWGLEVIAIGRLETELWSATPSRNALSAFLNPENTDVGFPGAFQELQHISPPSLKCYKRPDHMQRVEYRSFAQAKKAARLKQVLVLFLAVVFGMLVSVSVNF